ncbi:hypothetical protein [Nesterenkonia halotolerans]|uniref:Uncharacterized protein n=1 Tax=Nesterenkonia halotolerans TaxID=225325 RepID=A0ABR9J601_9MICC|nr:hypothetical protein [Nesterenkonia halotolerans]MBE1514272.1 hypothetical protein [Nesterenkonia halotolerans]
MGDQRALTSAAISAGSLICVLALTGCGEVVQADSEQDQKSVLVLDRGPHTEADERPAESETSSAPREDAQAEEFSLAELQDMPYEQFRSGEVSREQRFQLLWHYAELSSDYAEHFAPEEGLDAYNPVETASAEDEPQEILDQYWYLNQLYHLGELLAEEHGGTDISMKLARVVDRGNVRELESMLDSTELDEPAWLLESRYELVESDECLRPPEGTDTALPWDEQTCWELEFEITQGEATSLMPYFHWTEFETAEDDTVGFWNRSALHWL